MTPIRFILPVMFAAAGIPLAAAEQESPSSKGTVTDRHGVQLKGSIALVGAEISIEVSGGSAKTFSAAEIIRIEFDRSVEGTPEIGDQLEEPWKLMALGKLEGSPSGRGGSGGITVGTPRKAADAEIASLSVVWRPAPETGHFTARLTHMSDPMSDAFAGLIIKGGTKAVPDKILLGIRATDGAEMRQWREQYSWGRHEPGRDIRVPYWLRIVHDEKSVTGLISPDGLTWRHVWKAKSLGSGDIEYGLATLARKDGEAWEATFDNVSMGSVEEANTAVPPRVYLKDGSVVTCPVTSTASGKLISLGEPWNRNVPHSHVLRIDFFHPLSSELESVLADSKPGVVLTDGDQLQSEYESVTPESLQVNSPILGRKEFRPVSEAAAIVLAKAEPGRNSDVMVELWDGQIIAARGLSVTNGEFEVDSPYFGNFAIRPEKIRRIVSR